MKQEDGTSRISEPFCSRKSSIHFPDSSGKLDPLRERFGVEEKNMAAVSRYIGEAVDEGVIKPYDEKAAKKFMKYVPFRA